MGKCGCGYTTDKEGMCNGTHKAVKALREDLIKAVDAIKIESSVTNAVGMKAQVLDILGGKNG
jgi:CDGSH-type Zn-finger protein